MKSLMTIVFLVITLLNILPKKLYAQSNSFIKSTHTFNGRTIPFQVFIPDTLIPGMDYPLVLVFHGSSDRGNDNMQVENNAYIRNWASDNIQLYHPCFILVPQCPEQRWWENVLYIVDDIIDSLGTTYPIDSTRIYVAGYSMGAYGAWSASFRYPIRFAAVIACAGTSDWIMTAMKYSFFIPPVWSFHGSVDNIEPVSKARAIADSMIAIGLPVIKTHNYSSSQMDSILATNPAYLYTEYPGVGHTDILNLVFFNNPRLINWLFNQHAPALPLQDPVYPVINQTNLSMPPIDFNYSSSQPVFSFGSTGTWDEAGVRAPAIIRDGDTLRMWYMGYDENSPLTHIGYAWSLDGAVWHRYSNNPVISPTYPWEKGLVAPCCVIKENNTFKLWYAANPQAGFLTAIGYATSSDGINWTKHPNPVFLPGDSTDWDYVNVGRLSVINDGNQYLMWYAAGNGMTHYQIGLATSVDGINWIKYNDPQTYEIPYINSDPVISFRSCSGDWQDVVNPSVIKNGSGYHMLYGGSDNYESLVYYASSSDGIQWTKFTEYPIFDQRPSWTDSHFFLEGCFLETNDGRFHYWYICNHFTPTYNFLIQPQLGYSAVVLNNLPTVLSLELDKTFIRSNTDSLRIRTEIKNLIGHFINVKAMFYTDDVMIIENVPLFDDGLHGDSLALDSIYGGYWTPATENTFNTVVVIEDVSNGYIYSSIIPYNLTQKVTSIGPIVLDHYDITSTDTIPNPGNNLKFSFTLRNNGFVSTAKNITSKITCLDTFATITLLQVPGYGDITAGSSATGNKQHYIRFSQNSGGHTARFAMDIMSDDYIFWSDTLEVPVIFDGLEETVDNIPKVFSLNQNYPNPFNPTTNIEFAIPKSEFVTLKVYNILGEEVATLVSEKLAAGSYKYDWDASSLASGVYLYKLQAGAFQQIKKMVLLR
jgi:predicted GH43/DUF377 family glycosyl hydrolase/pimeloyl-ACP methyl ester carboxylesterase